MVPVGTDQNLSEGQALSTEDGAHLLRLLVSALLASSVIFAQSYPALALCAQSFV